LRLTVDCPTPLMVQGNRDLLAQALSNILDNSIKYTPSGGTISVQTQAINDLVMIQICDTGIGVPFEHHDHIFQRFVRLDTARNQPGNGLGLAQVLATIKAHHGTIRLLDHHPGLCLRIHLPLVG
jgi:signal transduction histidine kinase